MNTACTHDFRYGRMDEIGPAGPHEIRLEHRRDVRLLCMPCGSPKPPPDPPAA